MSPNSYGAKRLTNRELGYLDRLAQRCEILRARVKEGANRRQFVIEWERELKALEWAISRIDPPHATSREDTNG